MLKVILNRLKPQAEEIIADEQTRFRAGRSTTERDTPNVMAIIYAIPP